MRDSNGFHPGHVIIVDLRLRQHVKRFRRLLIRTLTIVLLFKDPEIKLMKSQRHGSPYCIRLPVFIGLPVAVIMAAAMAARAYDTLWIAPQQPVSSMKLKANLDEIQSRLAALETERTFRATITTTGAITSQTGSWISLVNHAGTGNYVVSFSAGTFTSTPTCIATAYAGNAVPPVVECFNVATTSITCQANAAGSNVDSALFLICVGVK